MALPRDITGPKLLQDAVWWSRTGTDQYGQPVFAAPVDIKCRWEDVAKEFISAFGESHSQGAGRKEVSRSIIMVDRTMAIGDMLFQGLIVDLDDEDNPKENVGAWEIKSYNETTTVRNQQTVRVAIL